MNEASPVVSTLSGNGPVSLAAQSPSPLNVGGTPSDAERQQIVAKVRHLGSNNTR